MLSQGRTPTYEQVRSGDLDLTVVLADMAPRGLSFRPLRPEPLCFIISPGHPLAKEKAVSEDKLALVPFSAGVPGNDFSEVLDDLLKGKGLTEPTRRITINDLRARKEAVRAGAGFTVVPQFVVKDDLQNKTLKILEIEGRRLPETRLVLLEARRRTPLHVGLPPALTRRPGPDRSGLTSRQPDLFHAARHQEDPDSRGSF